MGNYIDTEGIVLGDNGGSGGGSGGGGGPAIDQTARNAAAAAQITATTASGVAAAAQNNISVHEARTDNPHAVTKAQLGLGNADNTSDADKPVSNAVQAAINAETAARTASDATLQADINSVTSGLSSETARAQTTESALQTDINNETSDRQTEDAAIRSQLSSHTGRTDNPHAVTLQQAADGQGSTDVIINAAIYAGSVAPVNRYATTGDIQSSTQGSPMYMGQLKYGADTIVAMGAITGMMTGDVCGVQATQLSYKWDGSQWAVQPHGNDAVGQYYDILKWYGTFDGIVHNGEVTARITCVDASTPVWDLMVYVDVLVDDEIETRHIQDDAVTDAKIGARTVTDAAGSGTTVGTASKMLTDWLQAIRNNLKWLIGMFDTVIGHSHDGTDSRKVKYDDLDGKPAIPSAVQKSATLPFMDGTASAGTETAYAGGDHVHPTDTTRAAFSHTHTKNQITDLPTISNDFSDAYKAKLDFTGSQTVTSLNGITVTKQIVNLSTNANQSLAVTSVSVSDSAFVIRVTATASIAVVLPTTGSYTNLYGSTLNIANGKTSFIHAYYSSSDSKYYINVEEEI